MAARSTKTPTREHKKLPVQTRRQIWGVLWVALGLFLFLSLSVHVTGRVGEFLNQLGRGLLAGASLVLPLIPLYVGVQMVFREERWRVRTKGWTGVCLLILLASLLHLISGAQTEGSNMLSVLWGSGIELTSGGVVGGTFAMLLCFLVDRIGAYLVVSVALLICLMIETEITPQNVIKWIRRRREKARKRQQDDDAEMARFEKEEAARKEAKQEQKFKADVPLGSFEKKGPKPEQSPFITPDREQEILDKLNRDTKPKGSEPAAGEPEAPKKETSAEKKEEPTAQPPKPAAATPPYHYPPLTLLEREAASVAGDLGEELRQNAMKLVETLGNFGVQAKVVNVSRGPSVTRYELQPSAGVRVNRIVSLADDIALSLASPGVRIEAPIPGKAAVGIELANSEIAAVRLRTVLESETFRNAKSRLSVALGRDIAGESVVMDLSKMPHLLIAGATGSGKSVCINTIIASMLYKASPKDVRLLMIDPKVVELGCYNGIPHLLIPVVTDPKKAAGALNWAVGEMLRRYKLFADYSVRDFAGFNAVVASKQPKEGEEPLEALPQIVVIIDELADLMMVAPNDVEDAIMRLAQMARAAGMHLVVATQRPSVDVITGVIKANIPSRISFAVSSQVDSRTILDMGGAEKLLGKGDMLYYPSGMSKPLRVQGCLITDKEVEAVVGFIKKDQVASYNEEIARHIENTPIGKQSGGGNSSSTGGDGDEELIDAAAEVVIEAGMASTSLLQRRLKLGYARASRIIDEMEERGIVGPFEGSRPRRVLISRQQLLEMRMNKEGANR